jgi:hypothetical protein
MNFEGWSRLLLGWKLRRSYPDYHKKRFQQRLLAVQEHLAECIDLAPRGRVRVISMCAGDGRDVIGVLGSHPRQKDVSAWLVESNRQTVADGARQTLSAGLENTVKFLNEDGTVYATYKKIVPADVVLLCGVWGHVPTNERAQLVRAMACLCKPGSAVIWTRGVSKDMTRLHEIESLFDSSSWEQVRLSITSDKKWAVATHRFRGPPLELPESGQIFHFCGGAGTH